LAVWYLPVEQFVHAVNAGALLIMPAEQFE
jgi:hypothetical protein